MEEGQGSHADSTEGTSGGGVRKEHGNTWYDSKYLRAHGQVLASFQEEGVHELLRKGERQSARWVGMREG